MNLNAVARAGCIKVKTPGVGYKLAHPLRKVTVNGLCTGCGTCAGICPNEALKMRISKGLYVPNLSVSRCKKCGSCIEVCPGVSVDYHSLSNFTFGKVPENRILGNVVACYYGHSADCKIRWNASSGGLVTGFLVYLLRQGIINGAVVTRMDAKNPFKPEVIIARTRDEIESASQSKYVPVPLNTVIRSLLSESGRFAVVGLPCHIAGIRKAEMLEPKLREKIFLHLGLFCGMNVSFAGTQFILQKMGIGKNSVKRIDYRRHEFPGIMSVELKDGSVRSITHLEFDQLLFSAFSFFCPFRCTLCADPTSEFADISFGTAWSRGLTSEKNSFCLSRTRVGDDLLQEAKSRKEISIEKIDCERIIEAERRIICFTKKSLSARLKIVRSIRKSVPYYNNLELREPSIADYIRALLTYSRMYLSSKRLIWSFLYQISGNYLVQTLTDKRARELRNRSNVAADSLQETGQGQ